MDGPADRRLTRRRSYIPPQLPQLERHSRNIRERHVSRVLRGRAGTCRRVSLHIATRGPWNRDKTALRATSVSFADVAARRMEIIFAARPRRLTHVKAVERPKLGSNSKGLIASRATRAHGEQL